MASHLQRFLLRSACSATLASFQRQRLIAALSATLENGKAPQHLPHASCAKRGFQMNLVQSMKLLACVDGD
jgi:hypothetical protein